MSKLSTALGTMILGLGGCAATLAGRYDLYAFNGEPLPIAEFEGVTALALQLHDDGSCRVTITVYGEVVLAELEEGCSWVATAGTVTVRTASDNGIAIGRLNGSTLTLTDENDDILVFVRR